MKYLFLLLASIPMLSCNGQTKSHPYSTSTFKHKITIRVVDTTDLTTNFWKINRQLEKQYPEKFNNTQNRFDSANEFYVTHLLKRRQVTLLGKTYNQKGTPQFCVSISDTAALRKFFNHPEYNSCFPPDITFAYGIENPELKGCLDLYALREEQITFQGEELKEVYLDYGYYGQPTLAVNVSDEAGEKLKAFSERAMKKHVAFLINNSVHDVAIIQGILDRNFFMTNTKMSEQKIKRFLVSAQGN